MQTNNSCAIAPAMPVSGDLEKQIESLQKLIANLESELSSSNMIAKFFMGRTDFWENAYKEAQRKYLAALDSRPNPYASIDPDSLRNRSKVFTLSK